jgi:GntR family transcriptional regulator
VSRRPQIRIDLAAPEPAYRQIAAQFRTLTVEGALQPGDPLPAVRRLAIDLGVHFNTVAEAYRQLAAEGWVEVAHGKPARVAGRPAAAMSKSEAESLRQRLRHLVAEMRARGISSRAIRGDLHSLLKEE